MLFESSKSLYSDTLLPDIFITEYMPSLDGDCTKVYIYCLFLSKHNKSACVQDLAAILGLSADRVKECFVRLNELELLQHKDKVISLADIKEKEINKIYRMKKTSSPEEALLSTERNKRRNAVVTAINNSFFQGVMAISWYTDIDAWFDKYKFDDDVMYHLFRHCHDLNKLSRSYTEKVAESWYNRNIKTSFDLDKYSEEYNKFKDARGKVVKKLKLGRNLTEYEENYVEKWVIDYRFSFEIIELCLKKAIGINNPFQYINTVLTEWHDKGLRSKEEIAAYEKSRKQNSSKTASRQAAIPQHNNFEQRKYEKDYFDNLYEEV